MPKKCPLQYSPVEEDINEEVEGAPTVGMRAGDWLATFLILGVWAFLAAWADEPTRQEICSRLLGAVIVAVLVAIAYRFIGSEWGITVCPLAAFVIGILMEIYPQLVQRTLSVRGMTATLVAAGATAVMAYIAESEVSFRVRPSVLPFVLVFIAAILAMVQECLAATVLFLLSWIFGPPRGGSRGSKKSS